MFKSIWDLSQTLDIRDLDLRKEVLRKKEILDEDKYLNPNLDDLINPFLFNQMDISVDRILSAIENDENIMIFGDYDADGISATAILYLFLKDLNANVDYFIPERNIHGYGLSVETLENYFALEEIDLFITVDCGITSVEEVEFLNDIGIDTIVTDHHLPKEQVPPAYALICTLNPNELYPFKELSGAGIVLKVIQALSSKTSNPLAYSKYLDLASIGTIGDIVPLIGENRVISKLGMNMLSKSDNLGLRALFEVSYPEGLEKVQSSHLLFNIVPKINASGRMRNAQAAISLLISKDKNETKNFAKYLIEQNEERKILQKSIYNDVERKIEEDESFSEKRVVVLADEKWDRGVLGIVAAQIADKYNKPCILLDMDKSGKDKEKSYGSCRSVTEFSIIQALESTKDLIDTFGGHKYAAGLSVFNENIESFSNAINEYAKEIGFILKKEKTYAPDFIIGKKDISLNTGRFMNELEPYGNKNEKMDFLVRDLEFVSLKVLGKGETESLENQHLLLTFKNNFINAFFNCILFKGGPYKKLFIRENTYDLILNISNYEIRGQNNGLETKKEYLNCELKSAKFSKDIDFIDDLLAYSITNQEISREEIGEVYLSLRNRIREKVYINTYSSPYKFLTSLDILQELDIIKYTNYDFSHIIVTSINNSKTDLNKSKIYLKANANGNLWSTLFKINRRS